MGLDPDFTLGSACGAEITLNNRAYLNFAGSSYLGLGQLTAVLDVGVDALRRYGSSGNPLPRRYGIATLPHQDVEREAACFFGTEAALYLPNGYLFGLLALSICKADFAVVYHDEYAHLSLREAIRASELPSVSYRHLDVEDCRHQIARHLAAGQRPLIVTDSLFSTFGEIAPLAELAALAEHFDGTLVVDEAHSFGILGQTGRGAAEHYELSPARYVRGGSLGKAFGASGGIIPGSADEISSMRLSSAGVAAGHGLPCAAAMSAECLRYLRMNPAPLQRLRSNTAYLKGKMRSLGLEVGDDQVPIASFVVGGYATMQRLQRQIFEAGIFVFHTRYMRPDSAGAIRCAVFADHTRAQLDALIDVLSRFL